jgi:hypothetical protein
MRPRSVLPPTALTLALLVAALTVSASGAPPQIRIRDIDGRPLTPFEPAGSANVIFFVLTDCPISNTFAPEIQRVCREYAPRGVGCSLMYEDLDIGSSGGTRESAVRAHLAEYGFRGMRAAIDGARTVANHAHASVTPQAIVVDRAGSIRYSGRINNFYASLGRPRQQVTEHDLRDALDAVLAGRPVPKPETQPLGCYIVDPALFRK